MNEVQNVCKLMDGLEELQAEAIDSIKKPPLSKHILTIKVVLLQESMAALQELNSFITFSLLVIRIYHITSVPQVLRLTR